MILVESRRTLEEVAVAAPSLVPCGVQTVVIAIVHLHDVPCVGAPDAVPAIRRTGDDAAVDARVVGQPVEQVGVALTHRRLVDGGSIGGILQLVGIVVQVCVVVSDVFGDPVIDGLHLLVGGLAAQRQLGQDGGLDIAVQLCLLLRCCVPHHGIGDLIAARPAFVELFRCRSGTVALELPAQEVAAAAIAGHMGDGLLPPVLQVDGAGLQFDLELDGRLAVDHLAAQLRDDGGPGG